MSGRTEWRLWSLLRRDLPVELGQLQYGAVVARTEAAARRAVEARRGSEPEGTWLDPAAVSVLDIGPAEVEGSAVVVLHGTPVEREASTGRVTWLPTRDTDRWFWLLHEVDAAEPFDGAEATSEFVQRHITRLRLEVADLRRDAIGKLSKPGGDLFEARAALLREGVERDEARHAATEATERAEAAEAGWLRVSHAVFDGVAHEDELLATLGEMRSVVNAARRLLDSGAVDDAREAPEVEALARALRTLLALAPEVARG